VLNRQCAVKSVSLTVCTIKMMPISRNWPVSPP